MTKFLMILATAASVATAVFSFSETRTTRRAQVEMVGTVWTWIEYQTPAGDYTETSIETERFQEFPHVDQTVIYDVKTGEVVQ